MGRSETNKVANTFNHFYTTIAANLVAKLPGISGDFVGPFIDTYYSLKGVKKKDFLKFTPISEEETLKHLLNLSSEKATGLDGMPAGFIKDGATQITGPITHIIILSLYAGNLPYDMKIARVVPRYKSNSKTNLGYYRPVSILSVVSKILERVVYNQIDSDMTSQIFFTIYSQVFCSSYSTDTCLTYLSNGPYRFQMDRGFYTSMVMIDLQKSFQHLGSQNPAS